LVEDILSVAAAKCHHTHPSDHPEWCCTLPLSHGGQEPTQQGDLHAYLFQECHCNHRHQDAKPLGIVQDYIKLPVPLNCIDFQDVCIAQAQHFCFRKFSKCSLQH
jgi:hypothetical protein